MTLTWHQASAQLKAGDRVRFSTAFDIFPVVLIPEGTTATVIENGLNELGCQQLIVRADDEAITCALDEWDGEIWLSPPLDQETATREPAWQDTCPIETLQA